MKEAQQSECRNSAEAGEDIDTVRSDPSWRVFQIPTHELSEGNESCGNQREHGDDETERKQHPSPTGGQRRHSPYVNFDRCPQQGGKGRNRSAQRGYRRFPNKCQQQERRDHRHELYAAAAEVTAQAESQETRDQDEILEIGKDADLRRDPADHQHLHEQAEQTDQDQLAVAESAKLLNIHFQATGRGRCGSKAMKETVDNEDRESGNEQKEGERAERLSDCLHRIGSLDDDIRIESSERTHCKCNQESGWDLTSMLGVFCQL